MRRMWCRAHLTCTLALLLAGASAADVETEYTIDGEPTAEEEAVRWAMNRARFSPRQENARLGASYAVPAGPYQPLAPHRLLALSSRKHATDLALTDTFQHNTPTGSYIPHIAGRILAPVLACGYEAAW
jgi:hypothetical protein